MLPLSTVPTPPAWFERAAADWQTLLVDHANCEKKAASSALAMMFAYADDAPLARSLSRLAREELRHFEQVQKLMDELGVGQRRLKPGRYAEGLRAVLRTGEPERKLDLLLAGAIIEARSCERFEGLAPRLADPLAGFYVGLCTAEARHFRQYFEFARAHAQRHGLDCDARLDELLVVEATLITTPDPQFRFHSGPPL